MQHVTCNTLLCFQRLTRDGDDHIFKLLQQDVVIMQAPQVAFLCHFCSDIHKMITAEFRIHENILLDIELLLVVNYLGIGIYDKRGEVKIFFHVLERLHQQYRLALCKFLLFKFFCRKIGIGAVKDIDNMVEFRQLVLLMVDLYFTNGYEPVFTQESYPAKNISKFFLIFHTSSFYLLLCKIDLVMTHFIPFRYPEVKGCKEFTVEIFAHFRQEPGCRFFLHIASDCPYKPGIVTHAQHQHPALEIFCQVIGNNKFPFFLILTYLAYHHKAYELHGAFYGLEDLVKPPAVGLPHGSGEEPPQLNPYRPWEIFNDYITLQAGIEIFLLLFISHKHFLKRRLIDQHLLENLLDESFVCCYHI